MTMMVSVMTMMVSGLEFLAVIVVIYALMVGGVLFEGYVFEKMFSALEARASRHIYRITWPARHWPAR
jgi:hypothetical protein